MLSCQNLSHSVRHGKHGKGKAGKGKGKSKGKMHEKRKDSSEETDVDTNVVSGQDVRYVLIMFLIPKT